MQTLNRSVKHQCWCIRSHQRAQVRFKGSTSNEANSRVSAAALLSRPPAVLPPPSEFEASYYEYQLGINRAQSKKAEDVSSWFVRKGAQSPAGAPLNLDSSALQHNATELEAGKDVKDRLSRLPHRTLYLLVRGKGAKTWNFPETTIEEGESLSQSALRGLRGIVGTSMDVWSPGAVPAAAAPSSKNPAFYLPFRYVRGTVNSKASDVAWVTKEEARTMLDKKTWANVSVALSDL